jgi:hypothetical protein
MLDIPDPHDSSRIGRLESGLIKQTNTDYVGGQLQNEVNIDECAVLTVLAVEQHGPHPFDLHHRAISELHRVVDPTVEVRERGHAPRHMVGGAGIEDPPMTFDLLLVAEVHQDLFVHQVNRSHCPRLNLGQGAALGSQLHCCASKMTSSGDRVVGVGGANVTNSIWLVSDSSKDVIPRSEKEGTKPPYVCPGCSNHTHGNN